MPRLLMTKDEILDELRNLGFDINENKGIYHCKIGKGAIFNFIYSKTVTVTIYDDLQMVKFGASSFDNIGMRGSNGTPQMLESITKSSLHKGLLDVCPEIKDIVRDNKLDFLLNED